MADEDEPKVVRNYAGNSKKAREEGAPDDGARIPKDKIISGEVVKRKKPLGKRIAETFTGDSIDSVGHFIMFDVVLPAVKVMISDAFSQGIERLLFGGAARNRPSGAGYRPKGYTSYQNVFNANNNNQQSTTRALSQTARKTHNFDEVILPNRSDADDVIEALNNAIQEFGVATVADLYDLVGVTGNWADNKWGWTDLRGSTVQLVRGGGYLLNLPETQSID